MDSVDCAISWQRQIEDKNHPLKFRIGINLGDVISKGDDMYGDGINIVARIEKLPTLSTVNAAKSMITEPWK